MGRPRKYPKVIVENGEITESQNNNSIVTSEPKVKKKRGRKPKIRTPEELALLSQVGKKKRGRKPKEKFNFKAENSNNGSIINETESIIVRLSINTDDIKNLNNDTKQPKPFDPNDNLQYNSNNLGYSDIKTTNKNQNNKNNDNSTNDNSTNDNSTNDNSTNDNSTNDNSTNDNLVSSHINTISNNNCKKVSLDKINNCNIQLERTKISKPYNIIHNTKSEINNDMFNNNFIKNAIFNEKLDNRQISLLLKNKYDKENKINVLIQLSHCNKMKQWPEKTNICCLWCCHDFDNTPWGIPNKYETNLFHLFGIFCSPNCAASYIFNNITEINTKWEYFSLLNLLYYKVYNKSTEISLAPSKLSLKKFGGCLDIDEYRDKLNKDNIYLLKFPPSISIIPIIEEINENKYNIKNMNKTNNFIPLDTNRIKNANKELKLKRSKPLTNSKNTLDSCMNINIIST
jgi:hypothetical protein